MVRLPKYAGFHNCPTCNEVYEDCVCKDKETCESCGFDACNGKECLELGICELCGGYDGEHELDCPDLDEEDRKDREEDVNEYLDALDKENKVTRDNTSDWKYHGFGSEEEYREYKKLKTQGENMSWEKHSVMSEFLKIAEAQDLLGLKKTAAAEKNPYQEDLKTIEEKRLKSPEKSIIEVAHPEPVYVAEARGDGGLVENLIEQQKKYIEMINKMPTGSLVGRYAFAVGQLSKFANDCDEMGQTYAADLLTEASSNLLRKMAEGPLDGDDPYMFDPEIEDLAEMDPLQRKVYRAQKKGLDVCGVCGEEDCGRSEPECAKEHGYDYEDESEEDNTSPFE